MTNFIWAVGMIAAFLGAPLLPGIINKVKAYYAGRKGPSLFQLYYDLAKLLAKETVYSAATTAVFRLAPVITLAALAAALLLLPGAGCASPLGFPGDIILFCYLCGLARVATVLGALDTGSSFEGMGASRECEFAVISEGTLITVFAAMILLSGKWELSGVLHCLEWHGWQFRGMALLLLGVSFFLVILTETCRVPVDDPDTHLELTMIHEAMILDNSGPDLAMIHYAAALKLWMLLWLEGMLFLPRLPGGHWGMLAGEIAWIVIGTGIIGIVESVMARFRFRKLPQLLSGGLAMALLAVVLLVLFRGE